MEQKDIDRFIRVLINEVIEEEFGKGERITWRELADRYGLTFHSDINDASFTRRFPDRSWPRYFLGPDEGTLDPETCRELVSVLAPATLNETVFFYYSGLSVRGYEPRLYTGVLNDVLEFFDVDDDLLATPEYWWPESREWCVCTDWDLSFTMIGARQSLADSLARTPGLEFVTITAMSRIDYRADEVNITPSE